MRRWCFDAPGTSHYGAPAAAWACHQNMPWGETWITALWQPKVLQYTSRLATGFPHLHIQSVASKMWISSDTNHKVLLQKTHGVVKPQNDAQRTSLEGLSIVDKLYEVQQTLGPNNILLVTSGIRWNHRARAEYPSSVCLQVDCRHFSDPNETKLAFS